MFLLLACTGAKPSLDDTSLPETGGAETAAADDTGPDDTEDPRESDPGDSETGTETAETGADCTTYADADGDGYGDPSVLDCAGVANAADCDDARADVFPGGVETCDGADEDCDGEVDQDIECTFSLDAVTACRLYGSRSNERVGGSSAAGDLDADGVPDLAVFGYDYVYVVSGADALSAATLELALSATALESGDTLGSPWFVADTIPDVDGDGRDELLVADPNADRSHGSAWIVRGPPSSGDLGDVADARITISTSEWPQIGMDVAHVGDTDGDGVTEILVGGPYDQDQDGSAWLLPADVTGDVDVTTDAATHFVGEGENFFTGFSLGAAGDVDGDGLDDVLIGAINASFARNAEGGAWLVLGPATGEVDLAAADARLEGEMANGYYGYGIAALGDLDGDGLGDFAVGGSANGNEGWVDVWPGTTRGQVGASSSSGRVTGLDGDGVGYGIVAGDVDGDGARDLVIPATGYDDGGVFLFETAIVGRIGLEDATRSILTDTRYGGAQVSIPGDVDGDGVADLLIGTNADSAMVPYGGSVSLVLLGGP